MNKRYRAANRGEPRAVDTCPRTKGMAHTTAPGSGGQCHRKVGPSQPSHNSVGASAWARVLPILALSLVWLAKLLVLWQLRDHPLLQPDSGLDTTAYVELATAVIHGNPGLGPGLYYLSPFYIYFLAVSLTLLKSFTAVRVLQVTLGTASVAFVFLTAQAWCGRRAAWVARARGADWLAHLL